MLLSFFFKKGPFVIPFSCRTPPVQSPPPPPTEPPILPNPELTDPPVARPAQCIYHPQKKKKKEPKAPAPTTSVQPPQAGLSHMGLLTSEAAGGIVKYLVP